MRILKSLVSRRSGLIGLFVMGLIALLALLTPLLALPDPFAIVAGPLESPSLEHFMGTDAIGRDLFSGVLHGARTSLTLALLAGTVAFACGTSIGLIAGYRGGWLDDLLMRLTEFFQVIPRFFLVVVAIAFFGPGRYSIVLVLGFTSWAVLARVVRTEVIATRNLEFVLASQALGATETHILLKTLLPNVVPGALVMLGLIFGQMLLIEASVGFIGLGDPGTLTWGMLAGQAQGFLTTAWWLAFFPGLAISMAVLAFNLLADAIADAVRDGSDGGKQRVSQSFNGFNGR